MIELLEKSKNLLRNEKLLKDSFMDILYNKNMQNLSLLINELISLPNETEWLEFKHNNFDPEMIGEDISALANSAAYKGKDKAYNGVGH